MQIDGNFGVTAGIAEMLVQSQAGEIELLPALPKEWPTGNISGLRARGGYEVSTEWRNGKLVSASVKNVAGGGRVKIGCGGKIIDINVPRGKTKSLDAELQ